MRNGARGRAIVLAAAFLAWGCTGTPTPAVEQPTPTVQVTAPLAVPTLNRIELTPLSPPVNLLANGTFEAGSLAGWEGEGAEVSQDAAHTGRWSARLANTSLRTEVPTTPGQVYKVTSWIKLIRESGSDWGGLRIAAYGRDWSVLSETGPLLQATHGSEWFKAVIEFTAELDATPIDIGYFGGPGRQLVAQVDDVYAFPKTLNQPPVVSAALTEAMPSLPGTQFYALAADDVDGAVVRVLWEFGDGGRALAQTGSRRVVIPGDYTATVTIADDEGTTVTRTFAWTATNEAFPTLAISTPAPLETTVDTPTVALSGHTTGQVETVIVSSDRGYVGRANGTEDWSLAVPLQPGANRLLVQAQSPDGRMVTQERVVRYVPAGPLGITITHAPRSVERWEVAEIAFTLDNSAATQPQFPYASQAVPGLAWLEGVSVEALFTRDNWATVERRPAFLYQPYERALKEDREWLYPSGDPVWMVRFAPPADGAWLYRLEAVEAKGTARSEERILLVTPPGDPNNHGPVRVAPNDTRYFEFADGTPFLGTGHGVGFSAERLSYEAVEMFDTIGAGNQHFFRWWVSGHLWASAWQAWRSRTLGYEGYVPATGLTLERGYGPGGLASLRLDAANPIMFQGFDSGDPALIPGRTYRIMIRWRTENVTGPETSGRPYGVTVKLTGWPEPGETGTLPALIPHVNGDTPWHVAYADFTASDHFLDYLSLILENTTAGAAYVDEVALYERQTDGRLGPQLLRGPRFNSHLTFDAAWSASMEAVFAEAAARGLYFKLVISEKDEFLLNHWGPEGLPEPLGFQFAAAPGTPGRWLHQAYWRYLFARFGAYRSIHSWELVNEAPPSPGAYFDLATDLALRAAADANPHPATISTWATLAEEAWNDPASAPLGYVDFHTYVHSTGWIEPQSELANDSAHYFNEYDQAARAANFNKPVIWGEVGIDAATQDGEEPLLANDAQGIWLHKMTWARTGPGGVYPLYWYTDNIFNHSLHRIFGAWHRFMEGIPLTNGRYQDAAASVSDANLRVLGQKDLQAGWAHLWIDNRQHTWRTVVDGESIAPLNGTVAVDLERPDAVYDVIWFDTLTGRAKSTQTLAADTAGTLTLVITDLQTDRAARILWNGN